MAKFLSVCVFSALLALACASSCTKPEVSVKSFTTRDATIVSQVGVVAEFTLKCSNPEGIHSSLYAEYDGKVTPVARIGEGQYQISWNQEIKKARSGTVTVRLFDQEGFAAIRKAQRAGECFSSVKSLINFDVSQSSAYNGPWVNSEILAAGGAIFVAYFAFTTRSKLVA